MKEKIDYKILKKFAIGKYSLKDFKLISHWFKENYYEAELKNVIHQHWDEFSGETLGNEKDLSLILSQIKQKIASEKEVVTFRTRLKNFYMQVAAFLLLPLLLYNVYSTFFSSQATETPSLVEIFSQQGSRTRFLLPDGTHGWLNSGSSLKYATNFLKSRNVQLIGEAWFEVVHNENKHFVVSTASLDVRVLGTKFNIEAFPEDKEVVVVLQEGQVKVDGKDKPFMAVMKPNEQFIYNKNSQKSTIQTVNASQFSAWKDGLLVFRNEPLSEVLKQIGRRYNVAFVLTDPELAKFRFRATFQEEPIEEVIRLISLIAPIEYSFDNRKKEDNNGVYEKRTITIRRKIN